MPHKDPAQRAEYHRQYMRERYNADPEFRNKHRTLLRKGNIRRRAEIRDEIAEFKRNGCSLCDESDPCCLTAHHTDPSIKEFVISGARRRMLGRERLAAELLKCVCLCENCHRKVHAGKKRLPPSASPAEVPEPGLSLD